MDQHYTEGINTSYCSHIKVSLKEKLAITTTIVTILIAFFFVIKVSF